MGIMRRPAAILFDVGDTLLVERRFDLEAGIRAVASHLVPRAPALARSFRDLLSDFHASDREPNLARWLVETVPDLAGYDVESVEDAIWPAVVTLQPALGARELLACLRGARVTLGAVSNAYFSARILRNELQRHGLAEYLAFVLTSGDLGVRKPACAIFEAAIAQAGAAVDEMWFVGDTYVEDIVGAKRMGLAAVWLSKTASQPDDVTGFHRVHDWQEFGALWSRTR